MGSEMCIRDSNGCGKTTLLRILCGTTHADSGQVLWHGEDIRLNRTEFHSNLAYVGHSHGIKLELSPRENLQTWMNLSGRNDPADLLRTLERIGLSGVENLTCNNLSAGQRRRVALGRLYLTRASVWILDEPLSAIDRSGIAEFESLLSRHADNGGITILTGHENFSVDRRTVTRFVLPA